MLNRGNKLPRINQFTVSGESGCHLSYSEFNASADDRQRKRLTSNLQRLRSVFQQLGNYSGFLPLDLVDEAILLLTDNRLNFAGVVGCLHRLNIGSVHVNETGNASVALEKLGLRKDSAVCDIQASSKPTEMRSNTLNQD